MNVMDKYLFLSTGVTFGTVVSCEGFLYVVPKGSEGSPSLGFVVFKPYP